MDYRRSQAKGVFDEVPATRATIARALMCVLTLALGGAPWAQAQSTFIVDSIADTADPTPGDGVCGVSGQGYTLRAAIQEANARAGADTINFNISGIGPKTISVVDTDLPDIEEALTIDGYTQSDAKRNTLEVGTNAVLRIVLNGQNA